MVPAATGVLVAAGGVGEPEPGSAPEPLVAVRVGVPVVEDVGEAVAVRVDVGETLGVAVVAVGDTVAVAVRVVVEVVVGGTVTVRVGDSVAVSALPVGLTVGVVTESSSPLQPASRTLQASTKPAAM